MKIKQLLGWRAVIRRNMPEQPPITDEIRRHTIEHSARFRGSVRLSTGSFWTNDEYEKERGKAMSTPLP